MMAIPLRAYGFLLRSGLGLSSDVDASRIVGRVRNKALPGLLAERTRLAIVGGSWSVSEDVVSRPEPPGEGIVFASCHAHWMDGVPWEETEVYRRAEALADRSIDPARKREKIRRKYAALDELFVKVRGSGFSADPAHRVWMSVASDGALLAGPNGRHRTAIGLLLDRPLKVRWLAVHPEGLEILSRRSGRSHSA